MKLGQDDTPFFILGCVRSGTTMLRDFLRLHPRLECPEETHFYRWADPYGSPRYEKNYITMKIFESHRRMDGISDSAFFEACRKSRDRREISEAYGRLYLDSVGNPSGRWFDKTPQNIYGVFLLANQFKESKFVHIYRHPLNVVASLAEGRVMARHSIKGGVNYWMESMILIREFKKLYPERIHELRYEQVCSNPKEELQKLCDFLCEDFGRLDMSKVHVNPSEGKHKGLLSQEDISYISMTCREFMDLYGYTDTLPH